MTTYGGSWRFYCGIKITFSLIVCIQFIKPDGRKRGENISRSDDDTIVREGVDFILFFSITLIIKPLFWFEKKRNKYHMDKAFLVV